jgi:hypothetical protein
MVVGSPKIRIRYKSNTLIWSNRCNQALFDTNIDLFAPFSKESETNNLLLRRNQMVKKEKFVRVKQKRKHSS